VVGEHERDAAAALAVEHEEGAVLGAAHDGAAATRHHVDLAEPAAPGRVLTGIGALGAGEPARDGMLDAVGRQPRLVRLLEQAAGGRRRQHHGKGSARQAHLAGVVVAGGHKQRAALLHVAGDVLVVEQLQDVAVLVAVEDDEVEVLDLLGEQLARGEGDEGELVDRRAVLLLRRTQNGEMHEVDGGIRAQQVAPGALTRMRFARHQ